MNEGGKWRQVPQRLKPGSEEEPLTQGRRPCSTQGSQGRYAIQDSRRSCAIRRGRQFCSTLGAASASRWILVAATMLLAVSAWGQGMTQGIMSPPANVRPPGLVNVGIEQHLDEQIPPDLAFRDEAGKAVRLGDYFGRKPMVLNLVYYQCPMLCGEVLSGLTSSLRILKFDVGKEFDILTISFDPRETTEMALAKKAEFLKRYGRPGAAQGWHFLTGTQESVTALTKAAGFQYEYDSKSQQFAHATAILLLTPEGRISRYLYGVEYPPNDLRLGLVEASENKIGNAVDAVLLYCYHYDPATGKYGAIIANVLRLAGAATILILGSFMFVMFAVRSHGRQ